MSQTEVNAHLKPVLCKKCESQLVYTNQAQDISVYEKVMAAYTCADCRQKTLEAADKKDTDQVA